MPAPCRTLELAGASVQVFDDPHEASQAAAVFLTRAIHQAITDRDRAILGLATGGTPIPLYQHLVNLHREGELSFGKIATYNLDEYYPIHPLDPNSYRAFMHKHLYAHVDLPPNQAHLLDGTVPEAFAAAHCAEFDRWIAADGGLDLQLLGIGRNGHIGFNEPCDLSVPEALALPTRPVSLHPVTLADSARDFPGGELAVPRRALTLGVKPILAARHVLMLAFGEAKNPAVRAALTGPVTPSLPASLLQTIPGRVTWMLDTKAAADLP